MLTDADIYVMIWFFFMMFPKSKRVLLFVIAFCVVFSPALFGQAIHAHQSILLSPAYDIEDNPYFEWVVLQSNRGTAVEKAKIEYLIERIRISPYHFIRNNVEYPSNKAATHLAWKYGLARKHAKTAVEFIQHLATRSLKTGVLYLMKLPDGRTLPVGELLTNELRYLESRLAAGRS